MQLSKERFDIAVIGAGIVGLAHALAACRHGLKVCVVEKDSHAAGASIRNFGFVTVTGQEKGDCWQKARRSRDVWAEIAPKAAIPILHQGLLAVARYDETLAVIEEFLKSDMGEACRFVPKAELNKILPEVHNQVQGALFSPHELRVESALAVPKLQTYLAETLGVTFYFETKALKIEAPVVETSRGTLKAEKVIVCPGDDFSSLYARNIEAYNLTRCQLQMLRLQPKHPFTLKHALMSDHGLARYKGYKDFASAPALAERLDRDEIDKRNAGVHLIVVQSEDGSLVVGDSHVYAKTPDPFAFRATDLLILDELHNVLDRNSYKINQQWLGTYASADDRWRLTDAPDVRTRVVIVTSGTGASTAFAIAEETLTELL